MKKLKLIVAGLLVVPFVALSVAPATMALDIKQDLPTPSTTTKAVDPETMVEQVINIALWIVGVLAVIMLIWGGIKYATSAGDANKVTAAKNTIMYAVIGLVVALFAWAIVTFVIQETT